MALDLKSLEMLEDKIRRTMSLVSKLRVENDELKGKLGELEKRLSESADKGRAYESMKLSTEQLEKELKQLQEERETVLTRVDGLLEDLSKLDV